MPLDQLLLFMAAGWLLNLTPGPDVLYIVSSALRGGVRAGIVAALGITAGCCVHIAAAALGVSALLMASSTAFTALKWVGAAYLLVVGLRLLFSKAPSAINLEAAPALSTCSNAKKALKSVFLQGFWTNVLNPKVAVFFLAFVPQFIAPGAEHPALQFLLLGLLFNVNALPINFGYAALAGWASSRTAVLQKGMHWLDRIAGAMFIGFGIKLALTAAPKAKEKAMPTTVKITPQEALQRTIEHREIFHDEMLHLMRQIMAGEMSPVMMAAIITGLRVKKETIGEITAAAQVMREFSTKVDVADTTHLVDIVGTGGDGSHTFNISTCSMFVAAAAGAKVSKHGGRSVSSKSGSADVLEALGMNINLKPAQIAQCLDEQGIGFMFAPNHHPAMKNVAPVRKELGVRTIFNILGPLTNPAGAPNILMGVFHPDLVGIQVRALQRLGTQHAIVVYGRDGMDEVSLGAATMVGELKDGEIREYEIHPEDFGMVMASNRSLKVETAEDSRAMLLGVLNNQAGPAKDIVLLNAGVALFAANVAKSMEAGIALARTAIESGAAKAKLDALVALSSRLTS